MRQVPAARQVVHQPAAWRWFEATITLLAAASAAAWFATHLGLGWPWPLACAVAAVVAAGAVLGRRVAPVPVSLVWDGSGWRLEDSTGTSTELARVDVTIDLGRFLFLRAVGQSARQRSTWLAWALAGDSPSERALCVALYASSQHPRPGLAAPGS